MRPTRNVTGTIIIPTGMYASCDNLQIPTFDDFLYEETEQFIVRLQFTGIYSTSAAYDIPLSLFDNDAPPDWTTQVDYYYDDQNRLISRREEHATQPALNSDTAFYYDGSQVALQARDGHLANRLTWGPTVDHLMAEEQLDWTNPSSPEADVLWTLGDHLNSNRDIVVYDAATETASIANHIIYDSFGNLESQTSFVITTDYRWTGRWFDVTVGLQNNVNRWYDPMIGQWASEDPIGFTAMDPSIRRYLFNSPLVALDPDGLKVRLTVPNSSQAIDELQALRSEFGVTGDLQVRDVPRLPAQGQQPRLETIDARVINGTYRKGDVSSEILWNLLRDGTDAGDFTSVDQIRQRVSAFKSIIDARDEWNVNFGGEDDTKYWDGNKLKGDVDILTALQVYTFGRQEKVGCQFAVEGMFALGLVNHYQSLYGSLDGLNAAIDRENPIEWLMEQFSQEVTGWDAWHFMPGTIVYIRNPNKYPDPGEGPVLPPIGDKWQGEQGSNTIYIGDGQMSTYGRWHTKSIWKAVGLVYEYKTNTRAKEWCGGVSEFSDLTDKQKMLIRAKLIRTWRIMPRPHFPNFEKR